MLIKVSSKTEQYNLQLEKEQRSSCGVRDWWELSRMVGSPLCSTHVFKNTQCMGMFSPGRFHSKIKLWASLEPSLARGKLKCSEGSIQGFAILETSKIIWVDGQTKGHVIRQCTNAHVVKTLWNHFKFYRLKFFIIKRCHLLPKRPLENHCHQILFCANLENYASL